jgi:hypothetical protein
MASDTVNTGRTAPALTVRRLPTRVIAKLGGKSLLRFLFYPQAFRPLAGAGTDLHEQNFGK